MSDSTRDPEGVYTFGEFTERSWTVLMLWADLIMGLYEDLMKVLKSLRDEIDLSWLDDAERMREELRDADRKYHAAA
ncbi:hypothetical protein M0Q28_00910 [Patescibacteria group bacterium]|nr:hypothetical protein [Patescibacteria group bacterium]